MANEGNNRQVNAQNRDTEFVLANNPETGQNATVTRKAFEALYKDQGFVEVDARSFDMSPEAREGRRAERNVGGRSRRPGTFDNAAKGVGAGSIAAEDVQPLTGSAADMASKLNLDDKQGGNKGQA